MAQEKNTNEATATTDVRAAQSYQKLFDDEAKIKAFDEIAKLYYEHNFGSTSKSDIDLLMFHLYVSRLADYGSDYAVSNQLGITQQRIQGLRIKRKLKYMPSQNFDWKVVFAEILGSKGNYDEKTRRVSVLIKDPNLYIEIENFLENELGYFADYTLNRKILQLRVEYCLELLLKAVGEENDGERKVNEIVDKLKQRSGNDSLDPKHLGRDLLGYAVDVSTVLANIAEIASPGNPILGALKKLLDMTKGRIIQ